MPKTTSVKVDKVEGYSQRTDPTRNDSPRESLPISTCELNDLAQKTTALETSLGDCLQEVDERRQRIDEYPCVQTDQKKLAKHGRNPGIIKRDQTIDHDHLHHHHYDHLGYILWFRLSNAHKDTFLLHKSKSHS